MYIYRKNCIDIMEIRQVNDIKPAGITRPAMPNEVKLLTEWMIQYQIEALAKGWIMNRAVLYKQFD